MLNDCRVNGSHKNNRLLLDLGRTEWSQTTFIWHRFGKKKGGEINSNFLMKEYAKGITSGTNSNRFLSNSFCMHLIIETLDNQIVKTRISRNKRNDNAGTWAFSLGKQICSEDFCDGNNLRDDFVQIWMRRAFKEEYGLSKNDYLDIVDAHSLRILSIDFESDRYNFAMVCTVRLNYRFDTFKAKVFSLLRTEEAIEIEAIHLKEIPDILISYGDEKERKKYHPSTYLRILLFYMHRVGMAKAGHEIVAKNQCVEDRGVNF